LAGARREILHLAARFESRADHLGHDPGGFRVWWRALTGSDETLENAYLMRLAGRFSLLGARAGFSADCRIDDPRWREAVFEHGTDAD
jgi:hypothetical protein